MRFHCAGNKSRKQISVIAVFRHHEEERFPYPRPGRANATPTESGWGWPVIDGSSISLFAMSWIDGGDRKLGGAVWKTSICNVQMLMAPRITGNRSPPPTVQVYLKTRQSMRDDWFNASYDGPRMEWIGVDDRFDASSMLGIN